MGEVLASRQGGQVFSMERGAYRASVWHVHHGEAGDGYARQPLEG
jgi:hypothetical protein